MLNSEFQQADQRLQEIMSGDTKELGISDANRLKLYGLSKQAKEGDCRMPMPPGSNIILRSKWDAWTSFRGMSSANAMQEFVSLMKNVNIKPNASPDNSNINNTHRRPSMIKYSNTLSKLSTNTFGSKTFPSSESIRKKGYLYKQRDVFKGWRPRFFVLKGATLEYYIEPDDELPQKSIDIRECSIVSVLKPAMSENVEYYSFVITHHKSSTTYNLASDNKSDSADWIVLLTEVSSSSNRDKEQVSTPVDKSPSDSITNGFIKEKNSVVNYSETIKNIPEKYLETIETAVTAAIIDSSPTAEWEIMFEKSGVTAKKRTNGSQLYVRGDILLPYSLLEVFELLMDGDMQSTINPKVEFNEKLDIYSPNTFVEYMTFEKLWPTSQREFTNLVHWRQLTDGTVVIVATSDDFVHFKPLKEESVRASLILGSFILKSTPKGTSVADLKGALPATLIKLASRGQPMVLATVETILDSRNKDKNKEKISSSLNDPVNFNDLVAATSYTNWTSTNTTVKSIESSNDMNSVVNHSETIKNVPSKYLKLIESAVTSAIHDSSPSANWEPMFEKNGVVGKKRTNGSQLYVRGDSLLPYSLLEVFGLLMDAEMQSTINPKRAFSETLQIYSPNTFVEYIKFHQMWPTSPRDLTNLVHWRQLTDGTVVIVATTENFEHLKPIEEGVIRASLILGSFTLKSTPKGTSVVYINQVDLRGSIPASVINITATSQPMILATIKKILDSQSKNRKISNVSVEASFKELLVASAQATTIGYDMVETIANSSIIAPKNNPTIQKQKNVSEPKPKNSDRKESTLNSIALSILFLPVFLYYVIEDNYRNIGFLGGLFIAIRYLLKLQLGRAIPVKNISEIPSGRLTIRFPVDLGKLLKYVEMKREKSELEVSLTHVTMKVCAIILSEMPSMNGHVFMGNFYPSKTPGIDVGVSLQVSEKETMIVKIVDADKKPIEYITNEIQTYGSNLRGSNNAKNAKGIKFVLQYLQSPLVSYCFKTIIGFLECRIGLDIPLIGFNGFPFGVCTIINSQEDKERQVDIDIDYQPSSDCAPIIISIGGISVLPSLDVERNFSGVPSLNYSVSIDSKLGGGSLSEIRRFCTQLQKFLNNPSLVIDRGNVSFHLDDKKSRKKKFFSQNR